MSTLLDINAYEQLDVLLRLLCAELAITETQYGRAKRAYEWVADWLSADQTLLSGYRPLVYPQGSIPLGTTVKPRKKEEFDADGVCVLHAAFGTLTAQQAYDLVLRRICEHETYRQKVSPQARCIRLDYEDQFHLDIVPAIPDFRTSGTRVLIPNRDRSGWQSTDPKGYQAWFESRQPVSLTEARLDLRAEVEPMPPQTDPTQTTPLRRVVQLAKRRRDVFFDTNARAPKSILLSTLAAGVYTGQPNAAQASIEIFEELLSRGRAHLSPPKVWNPSNPEENLARHWQEDPQNYTAYISFIGDYAARLRTLFQQRGIHSVAKALQDLFDPADSGAVSRAVTAFTASFQKERLGSALRMRSGQSPSLVGHTAQRFAASIAIPATNFFGD